MRLSLHAAVLTAALTPACGLANEVDIDPAGTPGDETGEGGGGGGQDSGHPGAPDGACPVTRLADQQAGVALIRVDDTHVYWLTAGGSGAPVLRRAPICGGTVQTVYTGQEGLAGQFALAGDDLYFVTQGMTGALVLRVPKAGGAPSVVTETDAAHAWHALSRVVADGDDVFFMAAGAPHACVIRAPRGGGASEELACDADGVWDLSLAGDRLWWHNNKGQVRGLPRTGGEVVTVADLDAATTALAVDATHAYVAWLEYEPLAWHDHHEHAIIDRVPLAGGVPERLFANPHDGWAFGVALDEHSVFFAAEAGLASPGVVGCAAKGGGGIQLLSDLTDTLSDMAVDDHHVYFGTRDAVWQIPK